MVTRISLNVKYLRENKKLSKSVVAKELGKKSQSIADYESGKSTPPALVLQEYADLFDVYVGDILGQDMWKGETRPPDTASTIKELERSIREKSLLHGTIEEQKAQMAALRKKVGLIIRELVDDPAKAGIHDQMKELLAILEK
jgi:transcriptional regulator with XRE-family HTH domain